MGRKAAEEAPIETVALQQIYFDDLNCTVIDGMAHYILTVVQPDVVGGKETVAMVRLVTRADLVPAHRAKVDRAFAAAGAEIEQRQQDALSH